ncbi:40S ribosomal eS27 domain-containing protein [Aspergillus affinis]|uniref:40S ribosomal eS27 domain-containing protein n=1 Tax=Aspergillus affinis TaxID=1070780 RepID=UPI0022FDCF58|nr:uncharacterized protein KD926_009909 [Aspergillus affinis]KAI9039160.1 hypothetical protein KD926_009909 [Aspergillus affinis]
MEPLEVWRAFGKHVIKYAMLIGPDGWGVPRLPGRAALARVATLFSPNGTVGEARRENSLQTFAISTRVPFRFSPFKQAISISAILQPISLIDFLSRQDDKGHVALISCSTSSAPVLAVDLLNPAPQAEARKHKLKTLVPAPRSFFMDVKCPGCFTITTVFSHAQTVVVCAGCSTVLCQPTGGKARLTEGCSFRRK